MAVQQQGCRSGTLGSFAKKSAAARFRADTACALVQESMWMVVGFEVMPCSIKREKGDTVEYVRCNLWGEDNNPAPQEIRKDADIIYTCAFAASHMCALSMQAVWPSLAR
jgi:ammonia channel protein AmtB